MRRRTPGNLAALAAALVCTGVASTAFAGGGGGGGGVTAVQVPAPSFMLLGAQLFVAAAALVSVLWCRKR